MASQKELMQEVNEKAKESTKSVAFSLANEAFTDSREHHGSHLSHCLDSLVIHKVQEEVVEAPQPIDRVPFPVLRPQEVPEHELVGAVLERRQALGVAGVGVEVRGVRVRGQEVLSLQRGCEAGEVHERMEDLRGRVGVDKSGEQLQELGDESDWRPGQNLCVCVCVCVCV